MRRTTTIVATAAMTLAITSPIAGARAEKVDVCHAEGNGEFHKINVSENAFDTHVGHGDSAPGEAVPGQPGMVFTEDCVATVSIETVAVGSFSNPYPGANSPTLTIEFELLQASDGPYSGTASYSYGANTASLEISKACVDEPNDRVTVLAEVVESSVEDWVGTERAISMTVDDSTVRARFATADDYDLQCSVPDYPASGPDGFLTFAS